MFRLLGILRFLDFSQGDEEEEDGFVNELEVRCSTHTYSLKTDGVLVRIVVPSAVQAKSKRRPRFDKEQNEDSFSISASFVAQMVEEFLHLTVTAGDQKVWHLHGYLWTSANIVE